MLKRVPNVLKEVSSLLQGRNLHPQLPSKLPQQILFPFLLMQQHFRANN
jgi:hypothetical protein